MKVKFILFLLVGLLSYNLVYAQPKSVDHTPLSHNVQSMSSILDADVDLTKGKMSFNVPVFTVNDGQINIPIYLNHDGGGVRPDQHPGWVGMNWNLQAGGMITRQIRGQRDESFFKKRFRQITVDWEGCTKSVNIQIDSEVKGCDEISFEDFLTKANEYYNPVGICIEDAGGNPKYICPNSSFKLVSNDSYVNIKYNEFYEMRDFTSHEPNNAEHSEYKYGLFYNYGILDELFNTDDPDSQVSTTTFDGISPSYPNQVFNYLAACKDNVADDYVEINRTVERCMRENIQIDLEPDVYNITTPSGSYQFILDTYNTAKEDKLIFKVINNPLVRVEMVPIEFNDQGSEVADVSLLFRYYKSANKDFSFSSEKVEKINNGTLKAADIPVNVIALTKREVAYIPGWKITTPDGFVYEYGITSNDDTSSPYLNANGAPIETSSDLFAEFFNAVNVDTWYLRKVTSPNQRDVAEFVYQSGKPTVDFHPNIQFSQYADYSYNQELVQYLNYSNPSNSPAILSYPGMGIRPRDFHGTDESGGDIIYPVYLSKILTNNYEVDFEIEYNPQLEYDYEELISKKVVELSRTKSTLPKGFFSKDTYSPLLVKNQNKIVVKGMSTYNSGRKYINNFDYPVIFDDVPDELPEILGMCEQKFSVSDQHFFLKPLHNSETFVRKDMYETVNLNNINFIDDVNDNNVKTICSLNDGGCKVLNLEIDFKDVNYLGEEVRRFNTFGGFTSLPNLDYDVNCAQNYFTLNNNYNTPQTFMPYNIHGAEILDFDKIGWGVLNKISVFDRNSCQDREFVFDYCNNSNERLRLCSFYENAIKDKPVYYFEYENYENTSDGFEDLNVPSVCHIQGGNNNKLPAYFNWEIDHWGFYNGIFTNDDDDLFFTNLMSVLAWEEFGIEGFGYEDLDKDYMNNFIIFNEYACTNYYKTRKTNADYMYAGALSRIHFPTKGFKEFIYEPHLADGAMTYKHWFEMNNLYAEPPVDAPPYPANNISNTIEHVNNEQNFTPYSDMSLQNRVNVNEDNRMIIGGLRIKQIDTYEKIGVPQSRLEYDYDRGTLISGVPKYFIPHSEVYSMHHTQAQLNQLHSQIGDLREEKRFSITSKNPMANEHTGHHMQYENITLRTIDLTKNSLEGRTEYLFTGCFDGNSYLDKKGFSTLSTTNSTTCKSNSRHYKRGLLEHQYDYKYENGSPILVQTTEYSYEHENENSLGNPNISSVSTAVNLSSYKAVYDIVNADESGEFFDVPNNTYLGYTEFNYKTGIEASGYWIYTGLTLLNNKVEKFYNEDGTVNLTNTTDYIYNENGQISSESVANSEGEELRTEYYYPQDLEITGVTPFITTNGYAIGHMSDPLSKNMYDYPIQIINYIDNDVVYSSYAEYIVTSLPPLNLNPLRFYELELTQPIPEANFNKATINTSGSTFSNGELILDPNMQLRKESHYINDREVETIVNGDVPVSSIHGQNNNYKIAEVFNAKHTEVFYTSFEGGDFDNTLGNVVPFPCCSNEVLDDCSDFTPNTGNYAMLLSEFPNKCLILEDMKLDNVGVAVNMNISFWYFNNFSIDLNVKDLANNLIYTETLVPNAPSNNKWQFYSYYFPSFLVGTNLFDIEFCGTASGGVVLIDDLRVHPSDARMTTNTYNPLYGITSYIDANNRRIKYEYDEVGRLRKITDNEGNLLKEYGHNFAD